MKITGINTSPRKGQSTFRILTESLKAVKGLSDEIETEIIEVGKLDIKGCQGCGYCKTHFDCQTKDDFQAMIPKLADENIKGIIIATPVYMGSMTSQCKAFLDRTVLFRRNGFKFKNRIGGVIAVGGVRNGGQELAIQAVHAAMLTHDMVIVGDGNDTSHFGCTGWSGIEGGIEKDELGLLTAQNLGKKVAEMLMRLN